MSWRQIKTNILYELFEKSAKDWAERVGRPELFKLEDLLKDELKRWRRQTRLPLLKKLKMENLVRMHLVSVFSAIENRQFKNEDGQTQDVPVGRLFEILFSEPTANRVFSHLAYGDPDYTEELNWKAEEKRRPKYPRAVAQ